MNIFDAAEKVAGKGRYKSIKIMIIIFTHICEHICEKKYIHMDVKM